MDNDDILKTSIQTNNKKENNKQTAVKKSRTAEGWPKWPCLVLIIVIEKKYSRPNPYILLPYFYYYGRHI